VYPHAGLAGDAAGAWKLCEVLLDNRPRIRAEIDRADPGTLARHMYETGYYEGIHDPRKPGGADANVADYARAITRTREAFRRWLGDWVPNPHVPFVNVHTVTGVQQALNLLGAQPRLVVDGIFGARTRDAVRVFQMNMGLSVDGVVGPKTRMALDAALGALDSIRDP
jgi:murein L,D-transpeptidase YcbB/YkuD